MAANLKGISFLHLRELVEKEQGRAGLERLTASLSEEARSILALPSPMAWYPLPRLIEIERRYVDLFHAGDVRQAARIGQYDIEASLSGVLKVFMRLVSVSFLVEKTAKLWSQMVDQGRMEFDGFDPRSGHGAINVVGLDPIDDVYCNDLRGSYIGAVRACGGKDVVAEHTECVLRGGGKCRFEMRWKV
jgi:hypothetical protein